MTQTPMRYVNWATVDRNCHIKLTQPHKYLLSVKLFKSMFFFVLNVSRIPKSKVNICCEIIKFLLQKNHFLTPIFTAGFTENTLKNLFWKKPQIYEQKNEIEITRLHLK